ncbi:MULTISPECIES: LysR substrate-binding domain-containing protein [unclassified Janthinobacterium]|uniref:LysR substrate-binding domain-containing protein n=1 Tax=unclassified Janthinobacterium TaxID=2610881 RepID=UPI00089099FF|nr:MULTISPECIES: LysR substrate-binding domain-containing protein [unclassified Janthinobacterium]SDA54793.1 DNA-binding transcriptional regulator, LysR family [Janthinobacterium sp. 551a]SFB46332.1 DNA-binding transcriptional regulator, LysR family [Janthinobacterium sp. 344]
MDLESLKIFCCVASELSVTQAATRLGRAPSSVTTRIQQLEADIGAELFVRTNKRMALSAAGGRFLDYAQRLLVLEEEARHVVTGGSEGGTLRVGSMESTAASRLPALLAAYHGRHPATRLVLSTGPSRPLLEQVRTGLLDCAFVALPPAFDAPAALADLGLAAHAVWREELCLLLPASEAPVRHASEVRTRSLAAFPQGCTYRALAEDRLGIAASTDWRVQEMHSYHTMIACVAAGACVTLLPASVLKLSDAPASLQTLSVGQVDTLLVWRAGFALPAFRNLQAQLDAVAP